MTKPIPDACNAVASLRQCPARSSRCTHQPVASGARLYGVPSELAALHCGRCNAASSTMKCTFYNKQTNKKSNYSLTYKHIILKIYYIQGIFV